MAHEYGINNGNDIVLIHFSSSAFVANIPSSRGYGDTLLLSGLASVLLTHECYKNTQKRCPPVTNNVSRVCVCRCGP